MYLKRYHDLSISSSGVWRILHKVVLGRLPASQRYKRKDTKWKRHEKQRPSHALRVDVKYIETPRPDRQEEALLPIHRHRRLHEGAGAVRLPHPRPDARDPVHRPRPVETAVQGREGPDRQRLRVRTVIPLAPARQGHQPRLHQIGHPEAQREGGEIASNRRRRVLPAPRRPGNRRRQPIHELRRRSIGKSARSVADQATVLGVSGPSLRS